MSYFRLDKDKAVNSLLYVVSKLEKADTHKIYKILYFADQKHLKEYGRPIIGDSYIRMQFGPVPSFIKNVVDEQIEGLEEVVAKYNSYFVKAIQELDMDYLSESEVECLVESINENKDLSFDDLTMKSHDSAYDRASYQMNYFDIAKATGVSDDVLEHINMQMTNEGIELR